MVWICKLDPIGSFGARKIHGASINRCRIIGCVECPLVLGNSLIVDVVMQKERRLLLRRVQLGQRLGNRSNIDVLDWTLTTTTTTLKSSHFLTVDRTNSGEL